MTATTNNKPLKTIRDGNLKATIWRNAGEKGDFYTVRLTRTWQDEAGAYHDGDTFSGAELLRIARLADQAYGEVADQRAMDRQPS